MINLTRTTVLVININYNNEIIVDIGCVMKKFFDLSKVTRTEHVPTKNEYDRRTEIDLYLTKENRSRILYSLAFRILRDANNDIESVINSPEIAWLKPEQQDEVIQNMIQILNEDSVDPGNLASNPR